MRIVSFLPSATEILYELGLGHQIVGVTHECKFPKEANSKPQVIKPSFDPSKMTSKEIDAKIVELMQTGGDIYVVDDKSLKKADPDIIIAQGICEVCSPFTKEIARALSILDGKKPEVIVMDPRDLDSILASITDLAKRVNKIIEGQRLRSSLEKRVNIVRSMHITNRPKVVCIEWVEPPFTAGHWVPQMIEYAGGINGLSRASEQSRRMSLEEVVRFDPDIIVMMPCGFGLRRTLEEVKLLGGDSSSNNRLWHSLRAVKKGEVYAVDAGSFFSKPSPRVVTGLEILSKIIHPEVSKKIRVPKGSYQKVE